MSCFEELHDQLDGTRLVLELLELELRFKGLPHIQLFSEEEHPFQTFENIVKVVAASKLNPGIFSSRAFS